MRSTGALRAESLVVLVVALLLVMVAGPAIGQERTGALNGVVTDQTGALLPGVAVTLTNTGTGRTYTTTTGPDGAYFARSLEPGRYDISFELARFKAELKDANVLLGQTL